MTAASKFFVGQRVRIKTSIDTDFDLVAYRGVIAIIVHVWAPGELLHPTEGVTNDERFELDIKSHRGKPWHVCARASGIEPIYDGRQKISWDHSSVVWRPIEGGIRRVIDSFKRMN